MPILIELIDEIRDKNQFTANIAVRTASAVLAVTTPEVILAIKAGKGSTQLIRYIMPAKIIAVKMSLTIK